MTEWPVNDPERFESKFYHDPHFTHFFLRYQFERFTFCRQWGKNEKTQRCDKFFKQYEKRPINAIWVRFLLHFNGKKSRTIKHSSNEMETKSFSSLKYFQLIFRSIRNSCKFVQPFAIQCAAIIADGYSADCFQLKIFPALNSLKIMEHKQCTELTILHPFRIMCCIQASLAFESMPWEGTLDKDKQNYFGNSDGIDLFPL